MKRQKAFIALLLLVPAPSIGAALALHILPGVGNYLFTAAKVWLLVFPLLWLWRESRKPQLRLPTGSELVAGILLGLLMLVIILAAYGLIGQNLIDVEEVRNKAQAVGISSLATFLTGSAYWVLINSLIEEFVWRWFVYRQCEILVSSQVAIWLSALFFTLHHIIALSAYFGWLITVLGSIGVFLAGAIWSWCYLRYRSLWPSYISHIGADLAIFMVGLQLLFS